MKINLKQKILTLVILPALLIGIASLLISNIMIRNAIEDKIKQQLKISANSGLECYSFASSGKYTKESDGKIKKGDFIISDNFEFVDNMLETGNVYTTFFYGDERIITSITDNNQKRIIGTKASKEVVDTVINQGKDYFTNHVIINEEEYYGYYIPVKQPGTEEIIGMFFAGDTVKQVNQVINKTNTAFSIAILIILTISIITAIILVTSITNSLNRTISQLNKLSEGSLIINEATNDSKRNDEIGDIIHATGSLRNSLINIIKKIRETTHVLFTASENFEKAAKKTSDTMKDIEQAIGDIAESAASQAVSTEDASKQILIMGDSIDNTVSAVQHMKSNTEIMKSTSAEALKTIDELNEVNNKTKSSIEAIYAQTNETNQFAKKIEEATNIISSIAEETNLLSLNASIEAARAGESGRGFAIVADQIKKLAELSSKSAMQIGEIIHILIENSNKAVYTMEEVKSITGIQNDNLERTKASFQTVYTGIKQSIQDVNQISDITIQLDHVRKSVIDIINNLSAISEENSASAEETSAVINEFASTMNDIQKESGILIKLAEDLKQNVNIFQL